MFSAPGTSPLKPRFDCCWLGAQGQLFHITQEAALAQGVWLKIVERALRGTALVCTTPRP